MGHQKKISENGVPYRELAYINLDYKYEGFEKSEELEEFEECENELDLIRANSRSYYENSGYDKI